MTSSRSEFVQNAIDSAIASRSVDVYDYLNGPRRPILEQQDTITPAISSSQQDNLTAAPITQEPLAPVTEAAIPVPAATINSDSVTSSTTVKEPNLQEAIDYAVQSVVNAPTVDVYSYLKKTNPVAPPRNKQDNQTPATALRQEETPVVTDNVQNAIQSAINSGGIDSQSYLSNSTSAAANEIDESIHNKLSSDDAIPPSTHSNLNAGLQEPLHSETDSAKISEPPTTAPDANEFGNEIDYALEETVADAKNPSLDVPENDAQPTPPLPPKELENPSMLDKVKDKTSELKDNVKESIGQNTDDGNNLTDAARTKVAAGVASAAAATASISAFASEKKDKLKDKIAETKEEIKKNNPSTLEKSTSTTTEPSQTNTSHDQIGTDELRETEQAVPQEHIDSKPPPPEPAQFKPVPPEPAAAEPSPLEAKPTPPEPVNNPLETTPSEAAVQDKPAPPPEPVSHPLESKPTPPEPISESKPTPPEPVTQSQPEPTPPKPVAEPTPSEPVAQSVTTEPKAPEPAASPEPPTKHHHKLLPTKPGHGDEKSKKCLIM